MAEFTYPSNDLEQGKALLRTLGSFWSLVYDGSSQVKSYARGRALVEQQSHLNLIEAAACASRSTVPIFHKENWHLLQVKQSDMNAHDGALLAFGDGAIHGNQADGYEYKYGESRNKKFSIPIPSDLQKAPLIMNRISDPSLVLTHGIDYVILPERNAIEFNDDPFENDLIERGAIWKDGEVTDQEVFLWVFKGEFDYQHIYDHFSHVLGMQLRSSNMSRDLLNSVFDAVVGGTAEQQVFGAICAIAGVPVVREPSETVEVITKDQNNLLVITNKNSYRFSSSATAKVSVGDVVTPRSSLINEIEIHEFNRGQLSSSISSLALSPDFLSSGFYGDLQFENKDVTLAVTAGAPPFTIAPGSVPSFLSDFSASGFTQYVNVFGIPVLATASVEYKKFLHAANVLAQYLDNDASGVVDNRLVVDAMIQQGAALLITKDAAEAAAMSSTAWVAAGYGGYRDLHNDEINLAPGPGLAADATLEEVLHLISTQGYAVAYPDVFGEKKDTEIALLMDEARGGYYEAIPTEYPAAAWYHYYDSTCDYACQVSEYFYWVLTSILGMQSDRQSQIRDEWELYTKALVELQQLAAYELFTDTQYNFPTHAPDGNYTSRTKVSFDVGGFPFDVEKFFDEIHARGVEKGETLAHLLDTRTNQAGEPTAANLPPTINPLKFLAETALRGNAFVVRYSMSAFGENPAGVENVEFLRKIIPPHTAMLLLIELQGFRDSVNMVTGEDLSSFTGAEPFSDSISAPDDSNRTSIRLVTGTCQ